MHELNLHVFIVFVNKKRGYITFKNLFFVDKGVG